MGAAKRTKVVRDRAWISPGLYPESLPSALAHFRQEIMSPRGELVLQGKEAREAYLAGRCL